MKDCTCNRCLERRGRSVLAAELQQYAEWFQPLTYCGIQLDVETVEDLVALLELAADVLTEINETA